MLKAVSHTPKGPIIMLGLSAENVRLLQEGNPIMIELSELNLPGHIAILYGETEEKMLEELKERGFSFSSSEEDFDA